MATALRGDEWYVFDEETGLIREIRAYLPRPLIRVIKSTNWSNSITRVGNTIWNHWHMPTGRRRWSPL